MQAFSDVDTVLSFLAIPDRISMVRLQKKMIDAAIEAGVRRFAPSEWGRYVNTLGFSNLTVILKRLQYNEKRYGYLRV